MTSLISLAYASTLIEQAQDNNNLQFLGVQSLSVNYDLHGITINQIDGVYYSLTDVFAARAGFTPVAVIPTLRTLSGISQTVQCRLSHFDPIAHSYSINLAVNIGGDPYVCVVGDWLNVVILWNRNL